MTGMKRTKQILVGMLAAMTFVVGVSSVAHAGEWVGGGLWKHGVGKKYVWSYYSHSSRYHSATAIGLRVAKSGKIYPGYEAKASTEKALFGNEAYYNVW